MKNKTAQKLLNKIENRTAVVGVIGLGHVGLPLAIEFARAGFSVTGFDLDEKKNPGGQCRSKLYQTYTTGSGSGDLREREVFRHRGFQYPP